ncbi:hypothetical protein M501DRAFT_1016048 [Patellaria atrata CBS 101060]|uniref:Fucose-specific lectin n=1 Tax=Patellaria atrata CBS 101060 TaxID=1346257 RepID=A0A9P4SC61_9PEZI|nr:hypothetical protein M501DRAFT_1016048 [Patellaria atrata CBS 101060]
MALGATISKVTDIHPQSYIGGFQFNNGRSYRIFYQTKAGVMNAVATDNWGDSWYGGDGQAVSNQAIVPTPIASCIYTDKNGAASRTFYIGKDYKVRCFGVGSSAGWAGGDRAVSDFTVAQFSKIGALSFIDGQNQGHLRVYVQGPDSRIQELCWDGNGGNLTLGHKFPAPLQGTSLAFYNKAPKGTGPSFRGYYQNWDKTLLEIIYESDGKSWRGGPSINGGKAVDPGTHISACVSSTGAEAQYWSSHSGNVTQIFERFFDKTWHTSQEGHPILPCCSPNNPRFLATCHVPDNTTQTRIRIFFVGVNGGLHEARRENDHWGWGGQNGGQYTWQKV